MTNNKTAEKAPKKPSHAELTQVQRKAHHAFGNRANFRGLDIGYRWQQGQPTDEVCLRVHVDRKLPCDALMPPQIFPTEVDGIRLDVIAASYSPSLEPGTSRSAAARQPYTMGGLSCGRHGEGTGTIGLVVIDSTTGKPGILSNWHVLAGPRARRNDPITQPGGNDGGFDPRDRVARLKRWLLDRNGDAALAELLPDQPWLPLQFGTFETVTKTRSARLGEILTKTGRSGPLQRARVDGTGLYRLPYETRPGIYEYRDIEGFKLVAIEESSEIAAPISAAGDSGAAWISASSGEAVGLQFGEDVPPGPRVGAASSGAIACDLGTVFEKLEVRLADFRDLLEQNSPNPVLTPHQRDQANILTSADAPSPGWPHPAHWTDNSLQAMSISGRPDRARGRSPAGDIVPLIRVSPNGRMPSPIRDHHGRGAPQFSLAQDIWLMRLYPALLDYDVNFRGVFLDEPIAQRISAVDSHGMHAFFARLINSTRHFDGIGLKQMQPIDFEGVVTYFQVCQRINALLEQL